MPIYRKQSLEKLKDQIDLVDVVSSHLDLKKQGAVYKALCPFHEEKTPSFILNRGAGHYHCFGCGAHGDAISFLMDYLHLSFVEAVEQLAEKCGIFLEKEEFQEKEDHTRKKRLKEVGQAAAIFFEGYLFHTKAGQKALQYLKSRQIDPDFIQKFQIGLAPKSCDTVIHYLKNKGFELADMIESGLISKYTSTNAHYLFADRIMFPIQDALGAVIGFSARRFLSHTSGGKYVNTVETVLFKKSKVLYGLHHCRKKIAKEGKVIIVEGQIDALRLIDFGYDYTVASLGTAFGVSHVQDLIKIGARRVYLAFDSDSAGVQASMKVGDLFQSHGIEVYIVRLPAQVDPDTYLLESHKEAFQKLLDTSIDYLSFLISYHTSQIDISNPMQKSHAAQQIMQQIKKWQDPILVYESLKKLSELMQLPRAMLGIEVPQKVFSKPSTFIHGTSVLRERLEIDILRFLILFSPKFSSLRLTAQKYLRAHDFLSATCSHIYRAYLSCCEKNENLDLLNLAIALDDDQRECFIQQILNQRTLPDNIEVQFMSACQKLLERNWMDEREKLKQKIQSGALSDEEAIEMAKAFDVLKKNVPKVELQVAN